MRKFYSILLFIGIGVMSHAQEPEAQATIFRDLAVREFPERAIELSHIYDAIDSLKSIKPGHYRVMIDSLIGDSTFAAEGYLAFLELDKHFSELPGIASTQSLLHAQTMLKDLKSSGEFVRKVHGYMVNYFSEAKNMDAAFFSQTALLEISNSDLEKFDARFKSSHDSMTQILSDRKIEIERLHTKMEEDQMIWMSVSGILLVLLSIFVIIFFITKNGLKRKLMVQMEKANDRTELEALTKKMNDLKSESVLFRNTAQATVDRLNQMDQRHRQAYAEIKHLNEEIGEVFGEIKQQCEAGKSGMTLTTYMEFQNIVSRNSASIKQRVDTIQESLK